MQSNSLVHACVVVASLAAAARAQTVVGGLGPVRTPIYVENEPSQVSNLYDGSGQLSTRWQKVWRPVCGSDAWQTLPIDLQQMAANHAALEAQGVTVIDTTPPMDAGLNLVFTVSGSIPAGAPAAIAAAESYIESNFSDPITINISLSFAVLSPGVLGGTGSSYVQVSWATARNGLINGQDANDTIQDFLPSGSTIPVRYSGSSTTNETRVFFTRGNYKATIGSASGTDASMQFNSSFAWDFDPSNGISGGTYSFRDVLVHETGHAMGFTSGVDFRVNDIEALDVYRFQRTDGTGDFNPDTTGEFQVRARLARFNAPNDDHNSDVISAEFRMSDGSPYQASHFREQAANIGIMDPAFASGETHFPNYYSTADTTMFDAIGYDR